MKWEDYQPEIPKAVYEKWEKTDIECPRCGKHIYKDQNVVLCCFPPKNRFECLDCGWYGFK